MSDAPDGAARGVDPHRFGVRVYYEDTDLGGVVYYANYLRFLERGRTEMLRAVGIDQSALKAEAGVLFVVRRCEIDYRAPARFDDRLEIVTRPRALGAASLDLDQRIRRLPLDGASDPAAATGWLVTAMVRIVAVTEAGRPTRLPRRLRDALGPIETDPRPRRLNTDDVSP